MIQLIVFLFVVKLVIGVVPGIDAVCTPEWIYPKCMFFGLFLYMITYGMATYLYYNNYLIQEDKIMASLAEDTQRVSVNGVEMDYYKRTKLEKSEKVFDKVALKSRFMNIFRKQIGWWQVFNFMQFGLVVLVSAFVIWNKIRYIEHEKTLYVCNVKTNTWEYKSLYAKIIYCSTLSFILIPAVQLEKVFVSVPKKAGYFTSEA